MDQHYLENGGLSLGTTLRHGVKYRGFNWIWAGTPCSVGSSGMWETGYLCEKVRGQHLS